MTPGKRVLKAELLTEIAGEQRALDNKGDRFYDLISALHKSVRGSALEALTGMRGSSPRAIHVRCPPLPGDCLGRCRQRRPRRCRSVSAWDSLYPRRRKANGRLPVPSSIWPARRKATRCTPPQRRRRGSPGLTFRALRNAPTKLMKDGLRPGVSLRS